MANCVHCGHPIPGEAAFCIECGKPRASAPAPPPPASAPQGSRAPWMTAAIVGMAILGGGLRQWWSRPAAPSPTPSAAVATTAPTPTPSPPPTTPPPEEVSSPTPVSEQVTILYESERDLDGDGAPERARVISLEGNPEPNSSARKQFQILSAQGDLRFVSEPFEEPFHTDLDELAESPEGKAGLHFLPGNSQYPRIRLIFTARSGNFVDFHFNGQQFELADIGD